MKNIILVIFFGILSFHAKAQYKGGDGDGHSMAQVSSVALSVTDVNNTARLKVYPNPAHDEFITVYFPEAFFADAIYVTDVSGRMIFFKIIEGQEHKIQLNSKDFLAGIYMVKACNAIGNEAFAKLVIY